MVTPYIRTDGVLSKSLVGMSRSTTTQLHVPNNFRKNTRSRGNTNKRHSHTINLTKILMYTKFHLHRINLYLKNSCRNIEASSRGLQGTFVDKIIIGFIWGRLSGLRHFFFAACTLLTSSHGVHGKLASVQATNGDHHQRHVHTTRIGTAVSTAS